MFLCIKSLFWHADKVTLQNVSLNAPIIIVGNPRSGTTFLHRILTENENFLTLTYLQMKYPSLTLWKLFDFLGLTSRLSKINYWPNNDAAKLASKLHKHTFGDKEEIGMFLEEIMFSHYFLYRRFPFPKVASNIGDLSKLSNKQWQKIQNGLDGLLRRLINYYDSKNKTVLLKENESSLLLMKMVEMHPKAKVIFIYRSADEISSSYQNLSIVSTKAKTGIDPRSINGWQESNNMFRLKEMRELVILHQSLPDESKFLVSYEELVSNIETEVSAILRWLKINIDQKYKIFLSSEMERQSERNKGYTNETYRMGDTSEYDKYFKNELSKRTKKN